jgi:alpha-1,2-mannosyltransferase
VWIAFRESLEFTRTVVLEQGGTGFHKIQSPFAALRLIGAPVEVAYAAQFAAVCTVAILLFFIWRSEAAFALKASALLSGALLATPYVLDYDLMVMAPAIAFLAAHGLQRGFLDYEKSLLAFCWIAPLISRTLAEIVFVPVGLIAIMLLFGIVLRRAATDRAVLPPSSSRE